jgi:hypothetical protein
MGLWSYAPTKSLFSLTSSITAVDRKGLAYGKRREIGAENRTIPAISSGCAKRPMGELARKKLRMTGSLNHGQDAVES